MTPHATVTDLAGWLGADAPADADRLLERASEVVDTGVLAAYATDDAGAPTDADVTTALRDATCAQVEFWVAVGEEHDVEGVRGEVSTPGASFTLPGTLAPRARRILTFAGLRAVAAR